MARYVPDILTHRWVIISPQRLKRPISNGGNSGKNMHPSVFCEGSEDKTPPEILRLGGGEPNKPGWKVRVFPNKYPITDFHEVIVHSPYCDKDVEKLPLKHVELVLRAYRDRFTFYKETGQVLIFCNHGRHAGSSVEHPHSQLVVLPFQINLDTLAREPFNNIVSEKKFFYAYCPDFSQWPYELWIVPKREHTMFHNITDEELAELAMLLQRSLVRLEEIYKKQHIDEFEFGYNYYIYPKKDWYLRIIPRFVHRAGFELGTGLSVNIVDPADAAEEFKGKL